jgi:hypothetical protein
MLKPELQDLEGFIDGVNHIVEGQKRVALQYFEDGSVEAADKSYISKITGTIGADPLFTARK